MAQAQPKVVEITLSRATIEAVVVLLETHDCVAILPDGRRKVGGLKKVLAYVVSNEFMAQLLSAPRRAFTRGVDQARFAASRDVAPKNIFIHP